MTPVTLLSALTARGVEFQASSDKVRFRPVDLVKPEEIEVIREHKAVIIKLLRSEGRETTPIIKPWPIIEGFEHFSVWVDPDGPWPEFVPGIHYDIRQPSRLRGLCSPPRSSDHTGDKHLASGP